MSFGENKSLGHVHSIIFWNEKQLKLMSSLNEWKSLAIVGEFGTGKTILLDAAVWRLEAQQVPVYVICALDYDRLKVSDDVLDILFR